MVVVILIATGALLGWGLRTLFDEVEEYKEEEDRQHDFDSRYGVSNDRS